MYHFGFVFVLGWVALCLSVLGTFWNTQARSRALASSQAGLGGIPKEPGVQAAEAAMEARLGKSKPGVNHGTKLMMLVDDGKDAIYKY